MLRTHSRSKRKSQYFGNTRTRWASDRLRTSVGLGGLVSRSTGVNRLDAVESSRLSKSDSDKSLICSSLTISAGTARRSTCSRPSRPPAHITSNPSAKNQRLYRSRATSSLSRIKTRGRALIACLALRTKQLHLETTYGGSRLSLQDSRHFAVPELHRCFFLGIVAVPIVHTRDVFLFRVIEDAADDKTRHPTARHQTRRRPTKVVTADVDLVTAGFGLVLADDVCTRTLCE